MVAISIVILESYNKLVDGIRNACNPANKSSVKGSGTTKSMLLTFLFVTKYIVVSQGYPHKNMKKHTH